MSSVPNLWNSANAPTDPADLLVYASNLLGSDPRVTNFGGGNTSSKVHMTDPLTGEQVEVLWVKGSGGDLGSAKRAGFASLYQAKVTGLKKRFHEQKMHEDEIVPLYPQCCFNLNPAAPSIDTPLHAFVPYAAVSHMHSDAVIAVAAAEGSEELTKEVFGGRLGWLPWKRPGFELGLMLEDLIAANPTIKGAMMAQHGFICWGDTWEECYALTIDIINQAEAYIASKRGDMHPFGELTQPVTKSSNWEDILPTLRGKVAHNGQRLIAQIDDSDVVLEFLNRAKMKHLVELGTSCPDHFLRTKIKPLVYRIGEDLDAALAQFRADYAAYYDRCKHADSPAMRNPNPSIVLIPDMGMVSFGKNAQEAKVTGQFFRNAMAVMEGAETLSKYIALPEQEAFNIEYWLLEEAKLKRMPPEKELSRRVAVITGAASGIGKATAIQMATMGACVVLVDMNGDALAEAQKEVQSASGVPGSTATVCCNLLDPGAVGSAFQTGISAFGGVDIIVANAGVARRGRVGDTTPEDYQLLSDLLMKVYFDTLAEGVRIMERQGTGGSMVVVSSKNGVAAGSNAALYSAAKSFELHLMRCTAADYAKHHIRCNAINPDGVVTGSAIWSTEWKEQTAKSLGIDPSELVDYYAKRSLLGTPVTPSDCAEAICWLASDRASRTTGCTISVDGGNKEGFVR